MISRFSGFILLFGLVVMPTQDTLADLTINGDFETGDFTGWTHSGTVEVASAAEFRANAGATGSFPTGMFAAVFGGGNGPDDGVISQMFATLTGVQYTLSFDYGKYGNGAPTQSIEAVITNVGGGGTLLDQTASDSSGTLDLGVLFDHYSFTFTALGAVTDLSFGDTSPGTINTDGVLDNVSVSTIPEPASVYLLSIGVVGLLVLRHRRSVPDA